MRFEAHWGSTVIELSFSREKKAHLGSKPKMAKKHVFVFLNKVTEMSRNGPK